MEVEERLLEVRTSKVAPTWNIVFRRLKYVNIIHRGISKLASMCIYGTECYFIGSALTSV